jgi:hypothetical protein
MRGGPGSPSSDPMTRMVHLSGSAFCFFEAGFRRFGIELPMWGERVGDGSDEGVTGCRSLYGRGAKRLRSTLHRTDWVRRVVRVVIPIALVCVVAGVPDRAFAATPAPHVATGLDTDVCAMCHRVHSAASDVQYRSAKDASVTPNGLIVGKITGGDVPLCYSCHGVDSVGSNSDVQSQFSAPSAHVLGPTASAFGPTPKQCSDCHDSHGTARASDGQPFSALLRSTGTTGPANSGEQYCANCHKPQSSSGWDGLDVYRKTAHYSAIPAPTSGTGIRCSVCHAPHGSSIAPLIQPALTPPAVPATVTVTANDRTLCFACHAQSSATYPGGAVYQTSAHALSSSTVSITAPWASATSTRRVGECQVCHAPMGRSDGKGGVVPKLAQLAGPALCLKCHTAGGAATTDFQQMTYPATAAPLPELLAAWTPAATSGYSRLSVYGQDANSATPRPLVGPREYELSSGQVGRLAVGDINGDGKNEAVVTVPGQSQIAVFSQDPLRGLSTTAIGTLAIASPADLVAVGDFLGDGSAPQIAVVNKAQAKLWIYRFDGSSLAAVAGPLSLDAAPSSIAVGDVTGTSGADIVVSAEDADRLDIFTASGGTIVSGGSFATLSKPTGLSIGDIWPGGSKSEIAAVNAGEPDLGLSVFTGDGTRVHDYSVPRPTGGVPVASAVGDIVAGSGTGQDLVVAVSSPTGTSTIVVYPHDSAGLGTAQVYETGARFNTGSVAIGDVDGDGRAELVVGNAGRRAVDGDRQLPSLQVMRATADRGALDQGSTTTYAAGGVEVAGTAPSLAIADVGGVGPSRHPWGAVPGAHVSTETSPFARHVECTDCHEVHEATSTPAAAPNAYGAIKGAWGVSVTNNSVSSVTYTERQGVRYEYELCFKCHSGWSEPAQGRRNLAFEFNPLNVSVHAVEVTATSSSANADSFVNGWGNSSVMYCKDCHADSDATTPRGPHSSAQAPLLSRPYLGVSPSDPQALCYKCHRFDVYYSGDADGGSSASLFGNGAAKLHNVHGAGWGLGCETCHIGHGSATQPHLLRADVGFTSNGGGGTCVNECHGGSGVPYTR